MKYGNFNIADDKLKLNLSYNASNWAKKNKWNEEEMNLFNAALEDIMRQVDNGTISINNVGSVSMHAPDGTNFSKLKSGELVSENNVEELSRREKRHIQGKFNPYKEAANYASQVATRLLKAGFLKEEEKPESNKFDINNDNYLTSFFNYTFPNGKFDADSWAELQRKDPLYFVKRFNDYYDTYINSVKDRDFSNTKWKTYDNYLADIGMLRQGLLDGIIDASDRLSLNMMGAPIDGSKLFFPNIVKADTSNSKDANGSSGSNDDLKTESKPKKLRYTEPLKVSGIEYNREATGGDLRQSLSDNLLAHNIELDSKTSFADNGEIFSKFGESLYNIAPETFTATQDGWFMVPDSRDEENESFLEYNPTNKFVRRAMYYQDGGILDELVNRQKKTLSNNSARRNRIFGDEKSAYGDIGFSTNDYVRMGSVVADIVALLNPEPISAVGLGLGSDIANLYADIDDGVGGWNAAGNFVGNLGLSLLGAIPIIGDVAGSGAKILKTAAKFAPKLAKWLGAGLVSSNLIAAPSQIDEYIMTLNKIGKDGVENEFTTTDFRNLLNILNLALGTTRAGLSKGGYKTAQEWAGSKRRLKLPEHKSTPASTSKPKPSENQTSQPKPKTEPEPTETPRAESKPEPKVESKAESKPNNNEASRVTHIEQMATDPKNPLQYVLPLKNGGIMKFQNAGTIPPPTSPLYYGIQLDPNAYRNGEYNGMHVSGQAILNSDPSTRSLGLTQGHGSIDYSDLQKATTKTRQEWQAQGTRTADLQNAYDTYMTEQPQSSVDDFLRYYNNSVKSLYDYRGNYIDGMDLAPAESDNTYNFNKTHQLIYESADKIGGTSGFDEDTARKLGTTTVTRGIDITDERIPVTLKTKDGTDLSLVKDERGFIGTEMSPMKPLEPELPVPDINTNINVNTGVSTQDPRPSQRFDPTPDKPGTTSSGNLGRKVDIGKYLPDLTNAANLATDLMYNKAGLDRAMKAKPLYKNPVELHRAIHGDIAAVQSDNEALGQALTAASEHTSDSPEMTKIAQVRAMLNAPKQGAMLDRQTKQQTAENSWQQEAKNAINRHGVAEANRESAYKVSEYKEDAKTKYEQAKMKSIGNFIMNAGRNAYGRYLNEKDDRERYLNIRATEELQRDPVKYGVATEYESEIWNKYLSGDTLTDEEKQIVSRVQTNIGKKLQQYNGTKYSIDTNPNMISGQRDWFELRK